MGDEDVVGPVLSIHQIGRGHLGDSLDWLYRGFLGVTRGVNQGDVGAKLRLRPPVVEAEGVGGRSLGRQWCDRDVLDSFDVEGVGDIEDPKPWIWGEARKARDFEFGEVFGI